MAASISFSSFSPRASAARRCRWPQWWTAQAACHISFRSARLVRGDSMKLIAVALLGTAFAFSAGDPQGFYFWKSNDLKMFTKSLSPKMDAKKFANERLGDDGNHYYLMVHREGTGDAELH